jgi:NADPH:quinone reductase-like Zn-dependent oxidoreductase
VFYLFSYGGSESAKYGDLPDPVAANNRLLRSRPEDFKEIKKLFNEKKLKPYIENTFTPERAAEAFEIAEKGKPRGKIIIKI